MILTTLLAYAAVFQQPVKVTVAGSPGNWQLLRDGKPYFIKGVGGTGRMDEFVRAGGNTMRVWGSEKAPQELAACESRDLTLMLGIWLGHKSYFNYKDAAQVQKQFDTVKADVMRFRNHSALLLWGLGNEMENDNDIPETWMAINDLSKMCHQLDPNHPTSTVIADFTPQKIANIIKYAPDIDILGINSYGGLISLPERLKAAGWKKPYIITEFGPFGPWEVGKTKWNAAPEPNSSEKAAKYARDYAGSIQGQPGFCLGSFAFLWGDKQEETPTWFGMFLPTQERTESVDVMTKFWSGKEPANRAPRITTAKASYSPDAGTGKVTLDVNYVVTDPDNDPLKFRWEVRDEVADKKYAGENERRPDAVDGPWLGIKKSAINVSQKMKPGKYRLYFFATDGKGNGASANLPFEVL